MKFEDLEIKFLGHSGFLIKDNTNEKRIAIDPYNINDNIEKADIILITHEHYDHCSIKDIKKLSKIGTKIIGPVHIQSAITKVENVELHIIEVSDEINFNDLKILATPAYNVNKYRDIEKKIVFHPKKEGYLGYLIKKKNIIIYHAGDTDLIPEMKNLTGYGKKGNVFITLLPVSGRYVMDVDEATEAAFTLKPTIAIPMHYGSGVVGTIEDANRFVELCKKRGINSDILEKI